MVGHYECKFQMEASVAHQPLECVLLCGININSALFGFVTKHTCDRQTDRIMTANIALA